MNPKRLLRIAALPLLLILFVAQPQAASRKRPQAAKKTPPTASAIAPEWQVLIRRTQESAEAAQSEARRAHEQSEQLQRQLEQNTRELEQLRRLFTDLSAQLTEARQARTASAAERLRTPPSPEASAATASPIASATATNPNLPAAHSERRSANYDDRLARVEEQVQINAEQIKEHAQTKVESDARFRVKLYGTVLMNAYLNTNDSPQRAVPQSAPPPGWSSGYRRRSVGATLRQTTVGLLMDGARLGHKLGRARVSAEVEADFYGGSADDYGAVLGQLRLRTASVRLDWERTSVVAGLGEPLISPRNPSSLAAVYYPALADAGNLWQWRPQVYAEHRLRMGEASEVTLQGGIILPFGETLDNVPTENAPAYEVRAAWRRGRSGDTPLIFGLGGHFGRRDFLYGRQTDSYAVTADWQVPLGSRFEVSGEAFFGRGVTLGEQSGANVSRHFALTGPLYLPTTRIRGVHAFGGWGQLTYHARQNLDFNLAWGREDPRNRDLRDGLNTAATRLRNETLMTNLIYQLRSNLLLSLEYRRLWTDYAARRQTNGHYNLAVGYSF